MCDARRAPNTKCNRTVSKGRIMAVDRLLNSAHVRPLRTSKRYIARDCDKYSAYALKLALSRETHFSIARILFLLRSSFSLSLSPFLYRDINIPISSEIQGSELVQNFKFHDINRIANSAKFDNHALYAPRIFQSSFRIEKQRNFVRNTNA